MRSAPSRKLIQKAVTQTDAETDADVTKPVGLRKRGGSWEMRIAVPRRLRSIIKSSEVVKSFGGVSTKEAYLQGHLQRASVAAQFAAAEHQLELAEGASSMTEVQLIEVARTFLRLREAGAAPIPLDDFDQRQMADALAEEAQYLAKPNASEDATVQGVALAFAKRMGVPIAQHDRFRFFDAIREGWLEHLERQSARLSGATVATVNPAFAGVSGDKDGNSLTLADAIDEYVAAPSRVRNVASTKKMDRSRLGMLAEIIGPERAVASLGRADMCKYAEELTQLPAHYAQRFPGKSVPEAIAEAKATGSPPLSATSVKRDIQAAKSFFRWLEKQELIPSDPGRFLDPPRAPKKSDRRSFSPSELRALLKATGASPTGVKPWTYWLVRIGMLHGFRLTEPLGLKVRDLRREDDGWVIHLRSNEYRSLKTQETARTVPLHPRLIELGLTDLVRARDPDELLIADTPRGAGRAFNAAQKKMGRIIRTHVSDDPDLVFHSLRHSFRDALRDAGCPRDVEERLGGWKLSSAVMDHYGQGHRMPRLREWIGKIQYEEVTID